MTTHRHALAVLSAIAIYTTALSTPMAQTPADAPSSSPPPQSTAALLQEGPRPITTEQLEATLQLLLQRGLISQKEYDDALHGKGPGRPPPSTLPAGSPPTAAPAVAPPTAAPVPAATPGAPAPPGPVTSKWNAQLYGFVEADTIFDSTQSYAELAGGNLIARPGTYAGDHQRLTFSIRNSRIGFRIRTPEFHRVVASAVAEMDFLGNQPPTASELAAFTFPTFRVRHFMLKIETPYITVLAGQYWQLFGWQPNFHPNTVAIQGVPGQIYARTPQLRLSHIFKTAPVDVEIAGAVARAPQRDSAVPDGQAGVRLLINRWQGVQTISATQTAVVPAGLGISGALRYFALPEFTSAPRNSQSTYGWGVSIDALLPIVPAKERRAYALTFTGSYVRGSGIADYYVMLSGGVSNPLLPAGTTFNSDIDNGLALYDRNGQLATVDWQSFMLGLQFYLPPSGRVWLAANYSQMDSDNTPDLGSATQAFNQLRWADANLFWDATSAVRFGLEYSFFQQSYADGTVAQNHRGWFSALLIF